MNYTASGISPSYKSTFAHLESQIVDEYRRVKSLRKVGERFGPSGPSHETISKILKQHNVSLRRASSWEKLTEKDQKKVAEKYNGENINQLAVAYDVCPQTIMRVLKKHDIDPNPRRKYRVDLNAFDTITPESVYWLGYLFGRGNVKSDYHFDIVFTDSDQQERVKAFKEFIGSNQPVTEVNLKRPNKRIYKQRRLVIGSKVLVDQLKAYNVSPITDIEYPNYARKDMAPHFIRGIFDARGRFSIRPEASMSLVGNPKFLSSVARIISKETGISGILNVSPKNRGKLIYTQPDSVKKVLSYLCTRKRVGISKKIQEFQQKHL